MLLELGADANVAAGDDMNSLHFAAQKGHTEVCRLLIGSGEHSGTEAPLQLVWGSWVRASQNPPVQG